MSSLVSQKSKGQWKKKRSLKKAWSEIQWCKVILGTFKGIKWGYKDEKCLQSFFFFFVSDKLFSPLRTMTSPYLDSNTTVLDAIYGEA